MHDGSDGVVGVEAGDFLQRDGLCRRRARGGTVVSDEIWDDGILGVHAKGMSPAPVHCAWTDAAVVSMATVSVGKHIRQAYADMSHYGRPTKLIVHRRRWRCQTCGATVPEPLSAMVDARRGTRRLIGYVQQRCFEQTFASHARDIGITDMTIRAMFGDLAAAVLPI